MDVMMLSVLGEFDDDQIENKGVFKISFPIRLTVFALHMYFDFESIFSIAL